MRSANLLLTALFAGTSGIALAAEPPATTQPAPAPAAREAVNDATLLPSNQPPTAVMARGFASTDYPQPYDESLSRNGMSQPQRYSPQDALHQINWDVANPFPDPAVTPAPMGSDEVKGPRYRNYNRALDHNYNRAVNRNYNVPTGRGGGGSGGYIKPQSVGGGASAGGSMKPSQGNTMKPQK